MSADMVFMVSSYFERQRGRVIDDALRAEIQTEVTRITGKPAVCDASNNPPHRVGQGYLSLSFTVDGRTYEAEMRPGQTVAA